MISSAGWKIARTAIPRSRSPSSLALSASIAPRSAAVWTSWPQAWQTPGVVDAKSQAGALAHGQGVDVGAQGDAVARLGRPDVGEQPGAGEQAHAHPGPGEVGRP
jgi:hypothetical protein